MGPFVFTKIQKALTKHWRSQGIRIFTYLDDGAGAGSDFYEAQRVSNLVRHDVQCSGFVANDEKSQWVPVQLGVAGLCFEFTDGDIPSSTKEGGCFSSSSAGCSSS